ncbi:unnamed protein product [Calypogeia fissa]
MVASSVGCALSSSCKGPRSFLITSRFFESKGTSEPEWSRIRRCTTETIGILPYGSSSSKRWVFLPQKTSRIQLSWTFVLPKKKAIVISQSSNPRVIASKQVASKGRNDRERNKSFGEVQIKGKGEKQAKGRTNSPASSSEATSSTRQVVVKDGFAGLSALKTQLENERPRISRVKLNDSAGELLKQRKQADPMRRQEEAVKSPTSPNADASKATSTRKMNSSDGPSREGGTTLVCLTNLANEVTEEDYNSLMQSIPEITSWKYLSDLRGQCLGYGFCEVQAEADIEAIIQYLSEQVFYGKKVKASVSERSGNEYKRSLERQTRPAVTSQDAMKEASMSASSSSSVKDTVSKGNPSLRKQAGVRVVWKAQPSSREAGTTETKSAEYSPPEFGLPQDGNVDEILENRKAKIEALQNLTPAVDMASNTGVDSSEGLDKESATKLTGQSVLEALQRAAALRDSKSKLRRRKGVSGGGKYSSDSEDDTKQGPLPPVVFKLEWASKIEELENDLKQLRMLS